MRLVRHLAKNTCVRCRRRRRLCIVCETVTASVLLNSMPPIDEWLVCQEQWNATDVFVRTHRFMCFVIYSTTDCCVYS